MKRVALTLAALLVGTVALSACGSDSGGTGTGASTTTGPIKIWYSNNEQEVKWAKQAVDAWNKAHADQMVTGEEIPAGKSSEDVITAAITAGTTPCLIFNTSPAAVSGFQKQGGLVDLSSFSDGASYIETRTGADVAKQYQSSDGHYYQLPWKSNPVMIFYNKKIFDEGRHRHREAAAGHLRRVPGHRQEDRRLEGRPVRHLPVAVERLLPAVVRLLPGLRGRDRRQATGDGRQEPVHLARGHGRDQLLEADLHRQAGRHRDLHR